MALIVQYRSDSPYFNTRITGTVLDVMNYRDIPKKLDDTIHIITKVHEYRPDLLAHDLYKNSHLWWVFAVRNPNVIQDPIWDFTVGKRIYLPKRSTLTEVLGT